MGNVWKRSEEVGRGRERAGRYSAYRFELRPRLWRTPFLGSLGFLTVWAVNGPRVLSFAVFFEGAGFHAAAQALWEYYLWSVCFRKAFFEVGSFLPGVGFKPGNGWSIAVESEVVSFGGVVVGF
jgi:hypothetical protein